MYVYITISNVGVDSGPYDLYSDLDGYTSAFEIGVSKASLEAGYATSLVPDGTAQIKIQSVNDDCNNYVNVGTSPLLYYFIASDSQPVDQFAADFINKGTYAYVYGAFKGYYNGSYEVPGNHLVKLNPDLTVDTSFDIFEGFSDHLIYIGATLTELFDGTIIVVGFFTSFNGENFNRIIKLNADGTVNNLFDTGTGFNNYTTGISEDNAGNYYISGIYTSYNGTSSGRLIKLLSDGSIDVSFNVGTGFDNASLSTLVEFDNSVYVSGYFSTYKGATANGIIKLKTDGSVDTSFAVGTGFQQRGTYRGVLMARIPGDDGIYCISYCAWDSCGAGIYWLTYQGVNYGNIVKLNTDGSVDTSFNSGGTGFNGGAGLISVVFGDKLLITGTLPAAALFTEYNGVSSNGLILLNADGSILQSFAINYRWVYTIGNTLYGTDVGGTGYNQIIYEFTGDVTTTTTTTTV